MAVPARSLLASGLSWVFLVRPFRNSPEKIRLFQADVRPAHLTLGVSSGSLAGAMIRYAALLPLLVLAACASPRQPVAAAAPPNPQAVEAAQVYRQLVVAQVEQHMLTYARRITYGYAVVNCGLRSPQWMDVLRSAYWRRYRIQLQQTPLSADEMAEAQAFAEAHISNPTPPPYICQRIAADQTLPDLDNAVGNEALRLMATERKPL